jgi:hypothetical protein
MDGAGGGSGFVITRTDSAGDYAGMRYIVSGYRRSGTSMMMRVLAALLMPRIKLIMYREFESCNRPIDGYSPAPTGLLEVGRKQYMDPNWLRHLADDRLAKIFFEGLPYLPGHNELNYFIIFMRRNPEEIKRSVERAEKYLKELEEQSTNPRIVQDRGGLGFDLFKEYNDTDIAHVLSICEARKDIQVVEVQFEDFIHNTEEEIQKLIDQIPMKIDDEKIKTALRQVNPEFHRIKCA